MASCFLPETGFWVTVHPEVHTETSNKTSGASLAMGKRCRASSALEDIVAAG
tara:strand:+ start:1627 stop:1782 length:156 start_codon:yes stop_codon:yes gene_type:complete